MFMEPNAVGAKLDERSPFKEKSQNNNGTNNRSLYERIIDFGGMRHLFNRVQLDSYLFIGILFV